MHWENRQQDLFSSLIADGDKLDCKMTRRLKDNFRSSFREMFLEHFTIASKVDWCDTSSLLINDIDQYSMCGLSIKTGKKLIGNVPPLKSRYRRSRLVPPSQVC